MQAKRKIAVLGSTGSIGTQALQVAALHSDRFQITALTANRSREKLFEQVRRFRPQLAGLVENGTVVGRLPELNISGDFFTILGEDYLGAIPDTLLNDNPGELCVARMLVKK